MSKGKPVIILKGRDIQGLAWAVASFNQLVNKQKGLPVVRKAKVIDYPASLKRGAWINFRKGTVFKWIHYMLAFKMNYPLFLRIFQIAKLPGGKSYWRYPVPENLKINLRKMGAIMNPLDIEWWVGIAPIRGKFSRKGKDTDKINVASDKDFESVYNYVAAIADTGGNVMLLFDDTRFPRHPDEKEKFKSTGKADTYFVNKLYNRLHKEFPKTKLMFLPVHYWGPGAPAAYPEPRDKYLQEVSKINKDVIFTWNGPYVCSAKITPAHTKWIQKTIKRKPVAIIFNGGTHIYRRHYVADAVHGWPQWYYKGFLNDVDGYMLGADVPSLATLLIKSLDYLWNPEAYLPSAEIASQALVGPGSYPYLKKVSKTLGYFDKWGDKVTPGAARNIVQIKKKVQELEKAYNICRKKYPKLNVWTGLKYRVEDQKRLLKRLGKINLKKFIKAGEAVKKYAIKETGFVPGKDILLVSYDFVGGAVPKEYSFRCEKRLATWVRGKQTRINHMNTAFRLPDTALSHAKELVICGQNDDSEKKCPIEITLNGNKVYKGPAPFKRFGWNLHSFKIEPGWLKEGRNTLSIKCLADSFVGHGPPFFMLNYAVLMNSSENK